MENGKDHAREAEAAEAQALLKDPNNTALIALHASIRVAVDVCVRGLISSYGKTVPPGVLLGLVAWHAGYSVCDAIMGDADEVEKIRMSMLGAFAEGGKRAPVRGVPQPPQQQQQAQAAEPELPL